MKISEVVDKRQVSAKDWKMYQELAEEIYINKASVSKLQWQKYVKLDRKESLTPSEIKTHTALNTKLLTKVPCGQSIGVSFILESIGKAERLVFVWNATSRRRLTLQLLKENFNFKGIDWIGAVTVYFKTHKKLGKVYYIDLICLTGKGKTVMDLIESSLRNMPEKFNYIELSSLPTVMGFYRKCGFHFGLTPNEYKSVAEFWRNNLDGKKYSGADFEEKVPQPIVELILKLGSEKLIQLPMSGSWDDIWVKLWSYIENGIPMVKKIK